MLERIAVPYKVDNKKRAPGPRSPRRHQRRDRLITTVRDYARFDTAIDEAVLLRAETARPPGRQTRPTCARCSPLGSDGSCRPTAANPSSGTSASIANGYSSLIVKLPSRHLTFILFANSDGLSSTFQLEAGDVTRSLFATLFLRLYT